MNTPFEDLVGEALLNLYTVDKYFYNVGARVKILERDVIPSMPQVKGCTDGVKIWFTPAWISATLEERVTTLTHEVLHICCKHLVRIRALPNINHMRMNVAADLSIAGIQISLGQDPPIKGVVKRWKDFIDMDLFEIYDLLTDEDYTEDLGHPKLEEPDETVDMESEEDFLLPQPSDDEEFNIDQAIQAAAVQAAAGGYSTAASKAASRQIDAVRAKSIKWDLYLTQVASRIKSPLPTWVRPNRRVHSQVYLPSKHKNTICEATMAIDVSGSVGEDSLNQICSVAQDILTRYVTNFHLMTFDDKIVDEWDLTRRDKIVELSLNGFGGTYVQVVIDHLKKIKRVPKLLVIATDGYIPKTKDPGFKVIWLIVDNPSFTSEYGTVLHINSKEL